MNDVPVSETAIEHPDMWSVCSRCMEDGTVRDYQRLLVKQDVS